MKTTLVPVYFDPGRDSDFEIQLNHLKDLLSNEVEFMPPAPLGAHLPDADAVVFPQLLGEAYRTLEEFKSIQIPILIITSEFGTLSMWDWEIASYLRSEGVETIAPYNLDQTLKICRALRVKRGLRGGKFLVFQDNPGEGFQPSIFKRFYWWEDECILRMLDMFGLTIVKKSFKTLGAAAKEIPDEEAEEAWEKWDLPVEQVSHKALLSAVKMYIALKWELGQDPEILGIGINCLNESRFSDTTPCLAWNMLYEEKRLTWGCEADIVSMLTQHILGQSLDTTMMMSNLYPFLLGQAALKHERIQDFPKVDEPENHILVAHCGYLGVLPRPASTEWTLRPKVLAIVDDNATAIDARLPEGDITLAKLDTQFQRFSVVEGSLEGYAEYPGSDCRKGAILRVPDGRRLVDGLFSHHYLLMTGHQRMDIELVGKVFGIKVS